MFIPLPTIPSIVASDDIQPTMLNVNLGPFKSIRFIVIFFLSLCFYPIVRIAH